MTSSFTTIRNRRDNHLLGDTYYYIIWDGGGVERSMVMWLRVSNRSPDIGRKCSVMAELFSWLTEHSLSMSQPSTFQLADAFMLNWWLLHKTGSSSA